MESKSSRQGRQQDQGQRSENSVLFALGELTRLEESRMESEAQQARAKRESEAAARAAAEAEKEAASLRAEAEAKKVALVAEAEARLRVEASREDAGRMASMRDEIARIREERELLHRTLTTRTLPTEELGASSKRWALAFGTSSLVAASLAALLVFQARTTPVAIPQAPVATPVAIAPIAAPAPTPAAVVVAAPVVEVPVAAPAPTPRRHAQTRTRPEGRTEATHTDELRLDLESDDVLSGIHEEGPRRRSTH
jgi:hypothetical protein